MFQVGPNYPHEPPKVKCETAVYHPNIDLEGNVCLNILREDWKPVLTVNSIVYGLQYLFLVSQQPDLQNIMLKFRYIELSQSELFERQHWHSVSKRILLLRLTECQYDFLGRKHVFFQISQLLHINLECVNFCVHIIFIEEVQSVCFTQKCLNRIKISCLNTIKYLR